MVLLIIIAFIFVLLGFVLLSPLSMRIDTDKHLYEFRFSSFFKTWLGVDDQGLLVCIQLPFYRYQAHPFISPSTMQVKDKRKKSGSRKWKRNLWRRSPNILRSFKVKVFEASIDTDNYLLNAQLVPVCFWLQQYHINASVNFEDASYCRLEISNNLLRMGLASMNLKNY